MKGVGILGLLLGVALMFYLMFGIGGKGSAGTALEAKKDSEEKISTFSGRETSGEATADTISLDRGRTGWVIKTLTPGGAIEKRLGLRVGDEILEIVPLSKDQISSEADAKAFLSDARYTEVKVLRGGQKLTMPRDRTVGAPVAPQATPATPATPSAAPNPAPANPPSNATEKTRDLIKKIETH